MKDLQSNKFLERARIIPGVGWVPELASIRPALGRFLVSAGYTCIHNVLIHTSATLLNVYKCSTCIYFFLLFIIMYSYFIFGFGAANIYFI